MDPNLRIDALPGCRGDCGHGRMSCPCPEECAPDQPGLVRLVLRDVVLTISAVGGVYVLVMLAARWWGV